MGRGNPGSYTVREMIQSPATPSVTLDDVRAAHARIHPYIHRTPVLT